MESLRRRFKQVSGERRAYLPQRSEVTAVQINMRQAMINRRRHDEQHNSSTTDGDVLTTTKKQEQLQNQTKKSDSSPSSPHRAEPGLTEESQSSSTDRNHEKSSIAEVSPPTEETPDRTVDPTEVITDFKETRPEAAQSVKMLTDEVSQIQEVRYCLKSLREQMAAKQSINNKKYPANGYHVNMHNNHTAVNGNTLHIDLDSQEDTNGESATLRQVTKRLYEQLKEMEKRHQEELERLQVENNNYKVRIAEQAKRLRDTEEQSVEKSQEVEELQRLVESLELEGGLKEKVAAGETELRQLRAERDEKQETERCEELEKEVAIQKEKLHHLDDMLKSQQRKVRHMIEQLQNSRTVIQERERFIRDLEEKVSYLEAENREMHDHMEYFLSDQNPPPLTSTENKPQVVYSKQLTPTSHSSKALPFIKVIEIKS